MKWPRSWLMLDSEVVGGVKALGEPNYEQARGLYGAEIWRAYDPSYIKFMIKIGEKFRGILEELTAGASLGPISTYVRNARKFG